MLTLWRIKDSVTCNHADGYPKDIKDNCSAESAWSKGQLTGVTTLSTLNVNVSD